MKYHLNAFNGVIIDPLTLPRHDEPLRAALEGLLVYLQREDKGLAWITLPLARSAAIPLFVEYGFVFHSCLPDSLTLVRQPAPSTFVPFVPTHILGAGAIVMNAQGEVLVVRERGRSGFNLPGGHIDAGERIEDGIVREVLEETGIETRLESIIGFTTRHPYEFGKSNMHFYCRLTPLTSAINIRDTDEIEHACWMTVDDYLANPANSTTNRQVLARASGNSGLLKVAFEGNTGAYRKQEIFMAISEQP
jgi:8-oxo-dGTP pyrophosphatase MutT (NUDIX family)